MRPILYSLFRCDSGESLELITYRIVNQPRPDLANQELILGICVRDSAQEDTVVDTVLWDCQ